MRLSLLLQWLLQRVFQPEDTAAAFTSGATTTDAGSLSGSATVGSTESTTAATDAYFDACFAPAMPLVMNRHLVLQLPLAMLYATFYTYGFDAGS